MRIHEDEQCHASKQASPDFSLFPPGTRFDFTERHALRDGRPELRSAMRGAGGAGAAVGGEGVSEGSLPRLGHEGLGEM